MEISTETFDGINEPGENSLKVEWPNKEELLGRMEDYVKSGWKTERKNLGEHYFWTADDEQVDQMTRLCLIAKFMVGEMQSISPMRIGVPIKVIESRGGDLNVAFSVNAAVWKDTKVLAEVDLRINTDAIKDELDIETRWDTYQQEYDALIGEGKAPEVANNMADLLKKRRVESLDIWVMGTVVQEFAHMLYLQEWLDKKSERREKGMREYNKYSEKKFISIEEQISEHDRLDVERRARIWEMTFLKKFFPDSRAYLEVLLEGNNK